MTRRAQDNTKALDAFLAAKFEEGVEGFRDWS